MPRLPPDEKDIISVKESVKDMPILALIKITLLSTLNSLMEQLLAHPLKLETITLNPIDEGKVKEFMNIVNLLRRCCTYI